MEDEVTKIKDESGELSMPGEAKGARESEASTAPALPLPHSSPDHPSTPPEAAEIDDTLTLEAKVVEESRGEAEETPPIGADVAVEYERPSPLPTHLSAHLDPKLLDSLEENATKLSRELHGLLRKLQGDMCDVVHNTALHLEVHKSASFALAEQVEHSVASLKALMLKCRALQQEFAGVKQLHAQITEVKKAVSLLDSRVNQIRAPKTSK